jgi:glutathione S-transferase
MSRWTVAGVNRTAHHDQPTRTSVADSGTAHHAGGLSRRVGRDDPSERTAAPEGGGRRSGEISVSREIAGGRLSVADLKVFVWIRHLRSGKRDYIPADLPDRVAAKLVAHFERVKGHPGMKAYYAQHGTAE